MREEWLDLDRRIEALDWEFVELARNDAAADVDPRYRCSQCHRSRRRCRGRHVLRKNP
nr:hypothetical protein [Mesorhizobium sophorae]